MSNKEKTYSIALEESSRIKDIATLIKLKLSLLVVFSAAMGYLILAGSSFSWLYFSLLCVGGLGVTGAANILNQVLEKDFDRMMKRTANRPLVVGRMKVSEAVFLAGMFCLVGIIALSAINPIAGMLGMLSLILYSFLYTPMKRYSTLSIWIGGIPGALPVLIGCVAAEGYISGLGIILFILQFLWQLPHFWSIGYLSFEDYKKAGFKVVPVNENGEVNKMLGLYCVAIIIAMICITAFAYITGFFEILELGLIQIVTVFYLWNAFVFHKQADKKTARKLMFSSFAYLPFFLLILWIA